MRAATPGDVVAAARALHRLPSAIRAERLRAWITRADWADRYRKRTGRAHPLWGNGTLMSAVMHLSAAPGREPDLSDRDYLEALALVLDHLIRRIGKECPPAPLPVSPRAPIC